MSGSCSKIKREMIHWSSLQSSSIHESRIWFEDNAFITNSRASEQHHIMTGIADVNIIDSAYRNYTSL
jgi:hypothetical protein